MKRINHIFSVLGRFMLLFLLFSSSIADEQDLSGTTVDKHIPFSGNRVRINNVAGWLKIQGWDKNEVHIDGILGDGVEELFIDESNDEIDIEVRLFDRMNNRKGYAKLKIYIPLKSSLYVKTVSADIDLKDLEADNILLHTVSGDLEIRSVNGTETKIKSVSGDIEYKDSKARELKIETVSGDIEIDGIFNQVSFNTVSGEFEGEIERLTELDFHSTSGDISLECELLKNSEIQGHTVSGEIELEISQSREISSGKGGGARFNLNSFSGEIHTNLTHQRVHQKKYGPGKSLKFTTDKVSGYFDINTHSGDIDINYK